MNRMHKTPRLLLIGLLPMIWGSPSPAQDAPETQADIITIRNQARPVWPIEDLRQRGFEIPDVPRDENALFTYLEAINAYKDKPAEIGEAFDYAQRHAWPEAGAEALEAYVLDEQNQKALALARDGAKRTKYRGLYFGDPCGGTASLYGILLPNLSEARYLSKLLVVDGRRLEAQGNYERAFANYTTAMRMGHHVENGITLIEDLVGVAMWSLGDGAVRELVLRRKLSAAQLKQILDELNELAPLRPTTDSGIANERIFSLSVVDQVTARPLQWQNVLQDGSDGTTTWQQPEYAEHQGWRDLRFRIGQLFIPDRTIKAQINTYFDAIEQHADLPTNEARWYESPGGRAFAAIPEWNIVARYFLPSLGRANLMSQRCQMASRTTRLAAALRLYAAENDGLPPKRLDDLPKQLVAEDLIDPFSGRQFIYDYREKAWRFYSIGENQLDEGGEEGEKPFEMDYAVRFPPDELEPFVPPTDDADTVAGGQ